MKSEKYGREKNEEKMNRRVFLAKSGKLVGLGILTHFALIGTANAASRRSGDDIDKECKVSSPNYCRMNYTCSPTNQHSCASTFTCAAGFTCSPAASNSCSSTSLNKCDPPSSFVSE